MTTPIDPGNTAALAKIAENGMAYGMDRGMGAELREIAYRMRLIAEKEAA